MSVTDSVPPEDEAAVRAAMAGVIAAWADNDADAFAERYAEDASIITTEGLYWKGREPIRDIIKMLYAGPLKGSKVFQDVEDVRFISDTVAVAVCRYSILMGGLTELPPEEKRRSTYVLSKRDSAWLVEAWQGSMITEPAAEAG